MNTASGTRPHLFPCLPLAVVIAACSQDASSPGGARMNVVELSPQYSEEEFFGHVYENGEPTRSTSYTATLSPSDPVTASRLRQPQEGTMFADPNHVGSWMYGWYDPRGSGGCGSLQAYLAGDTTARLTETHRTAPGQPLPTYKERHCIRPGTYDFEVVGAAGGRLMRIDYLQNAVDSAGSTIYITNAPAGVQEVTDPETYADANTFSDYVVHVDFTASGYQETARLDVENALSEPLKRTFANQASPAGTQQDWFRFSTAQSSSGWNLSNRGTYLAKLYWDYTRDLAIATNYYDPKSTAYLIRSHQFASHVTSSRDVIVGFELKRPDEDTSSSSVVTRTVTVTVNQPPQPLVNSITGPALLVAGCRVRRGAAVHVRRVVLLSLSWSGAAGRHGPALPADGHRRSFPVHLSTPQSRHRSDAHYKAGEVLRGGFHPWRIRGCGG